MLISFKYTSLLPINVFSFLTNFDPKEDISSFLTLKTLMRECGQWLCLDQSRYWLLQKNGKNSSEFPSMRTGPIPL